MGILAKRTVTYLQSNGYVDESVQKAGVPGIPGCTEHAFTIWDAIQEAKKPTKVWTWYGWIWRMPTGPYPMNCWWKQWISSIFRKRCKASWKNTMITSGCDSQPKTSPPSDTNWRLGLQQAALYLSSGSSWWWRCYWDLQTARRKKQRWDRRRKPSWMTWPYWQEMCTQCRVFWPGWMSWSLGPGWSLKPRNLEAWPSKKGSRGNRSSQLQGNRCPQ